ncbi:MAG: DedA family protein, partial [Planctomycetes bacterium]|nr:DedA family protein [Planctomycetota bacterium]
GDNLGFWLGRKGARPRLQKGQRFLFLTPRTFALAEDYFQRYGTWTILFARFVMVLRVVGALAAGTAGMPWPRFLAANALGAILWVTAISFLGYFFGRSWRFLEQFLGMSGWAALGVLVLLLGLHWLWSRHRKSHQPSAISDQLKSETQDQVK